MCHVRYRIFEIPFFQKRGCYFSKQKAIQRASFFRDVFNN
ncbi:hypothetical protein ABIC10_006603 [Bradyrhizobium sp. S3.2.12]